MNFYVIANSDAASEHDNAHYSGPAYQDARPISVAELLQQAGLKRLDLSTWVTDSGHGDKSGLSEPNHRSDGQVVDFDTLRSDVLAQLAWGHPVPGGGKHLYELASDEVNLPEIGLVGVSSEPGAVLHKRPRVCVSSDTHTRNQLDLLDRMLREVVHLAQVERHNRSHGAIIAFDATIRL